MFPTVYHFIWNFDSFNFSTYIWYFFYSFNSAWSKKMRLWEIIIDNGIIFFYSECVIRKQIRFVLFFWIIYAEKIISAVNENVREIGLMTNLTVRYINLLIRSGVRPFRTRWKAIKHTAHVSLSDEKRYRCTPFDLSLITLVYFLLLQKKEIQWNSSFYGIGVNFIQLWSILGNVFRENPFMRKYYFINFHCSLCSMYAGIYC